MHFGRCQTHQAKESEEYKSEEERGIKHKDGWREPLTQLVHNARSGELGGKREKRDCIHEQQGAKNRENIVNSKSRRLQKGQMSGRICTREQTNVGS